jgi:UrcA family protein
MNISTVASSKAIASLIICGLGLVAGSAYADAPQPTDPPSEHVTYGDLNLDTPSGAHSLYARLRHAAVDVCLPLQPHDFAHKGPWQACYDNALSSAVSQINRPALTALHNQSSHASHPVQG